MNRLLLTLLAALTLATAGAIERKSPQEEGMDPVRLARVDDLILSAIARQEIPGAVLAVVRNSSLVYLKAYGSKQVYPTVEPMTDNTIFDLASCSKAVGTTLALMHLLEQGGYSLTDRVDKYLPHFRPYTDPHSGEETPIRITDLLTHTSGLPPYASPAAVIQTCGKADPDSLMSYICRAPRAFRPGTDFLYSCLNFITLQHILQRITGERLCDYAQKHVFDALGLTHTTYRPLHSGRPDLLALIAPTERMPDGTMLRGEVHDPLARLLNDGNSGNAGVFSNAEDLATLAAALLNGGQIDGRRLLSPLTVAAMTRVPQAVKHSGRSLGWDNYSAYASGHGQLLHPTRTFGHTGYTGPSLVIDPESRVAIILLAHRVHPTDKGSLTTLRTLVANVVASAITD